MGFWDGLEKFLNVVGNVANAAAGLCDNSLLLDVYRYDISSAPSNYFYDLSAAQISLYFPSLYFVHLVNAHTQMEEQCATISDEDTVQVRVEKLINILSCLPTEYFVSSLEPWKRQELTSTFSPLLDNRLEPFNFYTNPSSQNDRTRKQDYLNAKSRLKAELISDLSNWSDQLSCTTQQLIELEQNLANRCASLTNTKYNSTGIGVFLGTLVGGPLGALFGGGLGYLSDIDSQNQKSTQVLNELANYLQNVEQVYTDFLSFSSHISVSLYNLLLNLNSLEDNYLTYYEQQTLLTDQEFFTYFQNILLSIKGDSDQFLNGVPFARYPTNSDILTSHYSQLRSAKLDADWKQIIKQTPAPTQQYQQKTSSHTAKNNESSGMSLNEAYEILGLQPPVTKKEVLAAYREKIKKFHPDVIRHLDLDPAYTQFASEQFRIMTQARKVICASL